MLFNAKLRDILKTQPITDDMLICYHDAFVASVIYSFGGIVILDPEPHMLHRVHGDNTSGIPVGIVKRIWTQVEHMKKYRGSQAKIARAILDAWGNEVIPEAKKTLETVASYKKNILSRLEIVFSPKYRTGDLRLTLFCKFKVIFGLL